MAKAEVCNSAPPPSVASSTAPALVDLRVGSRHDHEEQHRMEEEEEEDKQDMEGTRCFCYDRIIGKYVGCYQVRAGRRVLAHESTAWFALYDPYTTPAPDFHQQGQA